MKDFMAVLHLKIRALSMIGLARNLKVKVEGRSKDPNEQRVGAKLKWKEKLVR
jgi:hypothetical protein